MVDDLTVGGGASLVAADLYRRVLGPSIDEIGLALARWTEYRLRNVGRVVENAAGKMGEGGGEVPVRVAMRVFEEASYADDNVIVEYLGGVLASAHTLVGRDDRGAAWATVLRSLSSYQLRAHYVIYRAIRDLYLDGDIDDAQIRYSGGVFIPWTEFCTAMEFGVDEEPQRLTTHALAGLFANELIFNPEFSETAEGFEWYGGKLKFPAGGVVAVATAQGAELFMWAHGHGTRGSIEDFVSSSLPISSSPYIPPTPGPRALPDLRAGRGRAQS